MVEGYRKERRLRLRRHDFENPRRSQWLVADEEEQDHLPAMQTFLFKSPAFKDCIQV